MSCERYREELTGLAAGAPAALDLEQHLRACPRCARELAGLREALALADAVLAGIASAEPSPQWRARIGQRVTESAAGAAAFGWRWAWAATAAALCFAVLALAFWREADPARPPAVARAQPAPTPASAPTPRAVARERVPSPARAARNEAVPPRADGRSAGSARVATAPATAPRRQPEVLVPAGEQRALLQLVALVHEQNASPPALLAAGSPSSDLPEPGDIRIEPLQIAPLDPAENQGM